MKQKQKAYSLETKQAPLIVEFILRSGPQHVEKKHTSASIRVRVCFLFSLEMRRYSSELDKMLKFERAHNVFDPQKKGR